MRKGEGKGKKLELNMKHINDSWVKIIHKVGHI